MCLNCLYSFDYCLGCIKLRWAVALITIFGLGLAIALIVLTLVHSDQLGMKQISEKSDTKFSIWFIFTISLTVLAQLLAVLVWTRIINGEVSRDITLQVFFWIFVAAGLIHLFLVATLLALCWKDCLTPALIHLGGFLVALFVWAYFLLIVNSFRMSQWLEA